MRAYCFFFIYYSNFQITLTKLGETKTNRNWIVARFTGLLWLVGIEKPVPFFSRRIHFSILPPLRISSQMIFWNSSFQSCPDHSDFNWTIGKGLLLFSCIISSVGHQPGRIPVTIHQQKPFQFIRVISIRSCPLQLSLSIKINFLLDEALGLD